MRQRAPHSVHSYSWRLTFLNCFCFARNLINFPVDDMMDFSDEWAYASFYHTEWSEETLKSMRQETLETLGNNVHIDVEEWEEGLYEISKIYQDNYRSDWSMRDLEMPYELNESNVVHERDVAKED